MCSPNYFYARFFGHWKMCALRYPTCGSKNGSRVAKGLLSVIDRSVIDYTVPGPLCGKNASRFAMNESSTHTDRLEQNSTVSESCDSLLSFSSARSQKLQPCAEIFKVWWIQFLRHATFIFFFQTSNISIPSSPLSDNSLRHPLLQLDPKKSNNIWRTSVPRNFCKFSHQNYLVFQFSISSVVWPW